MSRSVLLMVVACLASAYLGAGGVLAWMIWPLSDQHPTATRVGYVVQIVARWPVFGAIARKAAS